MLRQRLHSQLTLPLAVVISLLALAVLVLVYLVKNAGIVPAICVTILWIDLIAQQTREQEAVLASMHEGVIALDPEDHIIRLNGAAREMLDIRVNDPNGRSVQEVIRNVAVLRFIEDAREAGQPIDDDLVLYEPEERTIQAHGRPLKDAQHESMGVLVVLSDVTTLRKLENVRREFVANVSHELRTPITAIKGYAETLLDGEQHNPADTRRFIEIIGRQADRLNALFDDLLSLSRIEQGYGGEQIPRTENQISEILADVVQAAEVKARSKEIAIQVECARELRAIVHAVLLEQAIMNLVENAIKYSEIGSVVELRALWVDQQLVIEVEDRGCGIEEQHLPRLFERFYRVDRARSRKVGGTGLGLSIVKHIAQAHGGTVEVESSPGVGSVFRLRIAQPIA